MMWFDTVKSSCFKIVSCCEVSKDQFVAVMLSQAVVPINSCFLLYCFCNSIL